ncbi:hypothetical protein DAPPUDRAFT_241938 [Daphnia pulex]|uniref:Uncharacterized protein n=1 Tax=Daphnia pulex TaxID=6669 RepID=E9GFF5_DAPPU|nr:hypothetical protein DAPPUDRAFT_241938 [Daphnia pulex]|eukprot:EFX81821.1 hypothetical protein DAPPUDRAFT_241938 [Daphnia pulex]
MSNAQHDDDDDDSFHRPHLALDPHKYPIPFNTNSPTASVVLHVPTNLPPFESRHVHCVSTRMDSDNQYDDTERVMLAALHRFEQVQETLPVRIPIFLLPVAPNK